MRPMGEHDIGETIDSRFRRQASLTPDNEAIVTDHGSATYRELDALAGRIAVRLLSIDAPANRPVALLMREGPVLVATMLAVARTGRIFLPFETTFPEARLAAVFAHAGASHILTDGIFHAMAERIAGTAAVTNVEDGHPSGSAVTPGADISADAPAYIIYTSGSTGRPKGVVISHACVLRGVDIRTRASQIRDSDRHANVRSSGVSAGMNAILLPLLTGACLCVFDLRKHGLQQLAPWITAQRITGISLTCSLLRAWIATLPADARIPSLRFISCGAEALYGSDVMAAARHLEGDWRIFYQLSSTETNLMAGRMFDPASPVEPGILHVGNPAQGIDLRVDCGGGPADGPGEIVVRSRSISLGYWNDPDLTAAAFSTDASDPTVRIYRTGDLGRWRDDGALEHLGRKNRKIKLLGYSVEPYEIENALLRMPGVKDAAVVVPDAARDAPYLVAYLAADRGAVESVAGIRRRLAAMLPSYMVPRHIVVLDAFPITPRGKSDLKALPPPDPESAGRDQRGPSNEQERALLSIWQEVLRIPAIGVDDNFYDLGGTSLQAFMIFARIAAVFGRDLPPTHMLQTPTIARQAKVLRKDSPSVEDALLVTFRAEGANPPLFIVHGAFGDIMFARELVRGMKSGRPVYGVQPPPLDGAHRIPRTLEEIAAAYLAAIRKKQPEGPYHLAGYSFGGTVALEMAQQLLRAGERVAFLGMIDTNREGRFEVAGEQLASRVTRHLQRLRGKDALGYVATRALKTINSYAAVAAETARQWPNALRHRLGRPVPYEGRASCYRSIFARASRRYAAHPYAGAIVMFARNGATERHRQRWRPLALGGFTVHEIPANHVDIVWPPYSAMLANHFDACLDSTSI
jgi:amino acid adenylation domain-containing protein